MGKEDYMTNMKQDQNKPRCIMICHREHINHGDHCESFTDMNRTKEIEVCICGKMERPLVKMGNRLMCNNSECRVVHYFFSEIDCKTLESYKSHIKQELIAEIKRRMPQGKQRLDSPRSIGDGNTVNVASGYNQALSEVNEILDSV